MRRAAGAAPAALLLLPLPRSEGCTSVWAPELCADPASCLPCKACLGPFQSWNNRGGCGCFALGRRPEDTCIDDKAWCASECARCLPCFGLDVTHFDEDPDNDRAYVPCDYTVRASPASVESGALPPYLDGTLYHVVHNSNLHRTADGAYVPSAGVSGVLAVSFGAAGASASFALVRGTRWRELCGGRAAAGSEWAPSTAESVSALGSRLAVVSGVSTLNSISPDLAALEAPMMWESHASFEARKVSNFHAPGTGPEYFGPPHLAEDVNGDVYHLVFYYASSGTCSDPTACTASAAGCGADPDACAAACAAVPGCAAVRRGARAYCVASASEAACVQRGGTWAWDAAKISPARGGHRVYKVPRGTAERVLVADVASPVEGFPDPSRPAFTHLALAVTPRYLVAVMPAMPLGRQGTWEWGDIERGYDPRGNATFVVLDKAHGAELGRYAAPNFFAWHLANAWEAEGAVVLDVEWAPDAAPVAARHRAAWPCDSRGGLRRYALSHPSGPNRTVTVIDVEQPLVTPELPTVPWGRPGTGNRNPTAHLFYVGTERAACDAAAACRAAQPGECAALPGCRAANGTAAAALRALPGGGAAACLPADPGGGTVGKWSAPPPPEGRTKANLSAAGGAFASWRWARGGAAAPAGEPLFVPRDMAQALGADNGTVAVFLTTAAGYKVALLDAETMAERAVLAVPVSASLAPDPTLPPSPLRPRTHSYWREGRPWFTPAPPTPIPEIPVQPSPAPTPGPVFAAAARSAAAASTAAAAVVAALAVG